MANIHTCMDPPPQSPCHLLSVVAVPHCDQALWVAASTTIAPLNDIILKPLSLFTLEVCSFHITFMKRRTLVCFLCWIHKFSVSKVSGGWPLSSRAPQDEGKLLRRSTAALDSVFNVTSTSECSEFRVPLDDCFPANTFKAVAEHKSSSSF